ncbi:MAG TPA: aspartyl protease family protein [Pyrinomonadaceae bacterium]|nr:aspartyl protease family protein [Pyrinomonadaceae bacterium]
MNKRTLLLTFLLFISLISASSIGLQSAAIRVAASVAAQAPAKAASSVRATIPFELNNKHIMVKAKVNGQPITFVLDTGDQVAIVDLDLARRMNLALSGEVRVGGAGAAISTGAMVQNATFTIDGLEGFSQPVRMALPLGKVLSPRAGRDFEGIIGQEFIQQFVVEIDYQGQLLRLHDKDKFVYNGAGESIPIKFMHGHPILEAEVTPVGSTAPLKGKFVLDTGAGLALALYSPFVSEHGLLGPETKTIRSLGGAGAGGETTGRIGRVTELKIGSYTIKSPITMFSQDKAGAFASDQLAGNIGGRVASKFRLFLDYGRKRIIFEPNSTFAAPYDHAQSGISVVAEGGDYRVFRIRAVLEDSPASEAGLLKDDVITGVNNQAATEFTLSKLNELFERPVPYKLTIRRGEQTLQLTLTPRRLL